MDIYACPAKDTTPEQAGCRPRGPTCLGTHIRRCGFEGLAWHPTDRIIQPTLATAHGHKGRAIPGGWKARHPDRVKPGNETHSSAKVGVHCVFSDFRHEFYTCFERVLVRVSACGIAIARWSAFNSSSQGEQPYCIYNILMVSANLHG